MVKALFIDKNERWNTIRLESNDIKCSYCMQIAGYDSKSPHENNDLAKAIFAKSQQEWKEEYEKYLHGVDNFDVVILHMSNRWAEKFFKLRCKGKYTVLFSGALTVSDNFRDDMDAMYLFNQAKSNGMCYFVSETELINNLGDFLSEWSQRLVSDRSFLPPFDVLRHGSHCARIVEAHRLRYELLTPFIALHLSIQAYVDGRNADGLRIEEFKNLNGYLNNVPDVLKLLAPRGPNDQSVFAEYQAVYKNYFEPFPKQRDICTLADKLMKEQLPEKSDNSLKVIKSNIETLAHNMEQAVSFIEFGDKLQWKEFD